MAIELGYQQMFDSVNGAHCLQEMEQAPKRERLFGDFFYKNDLAVLCGPEGSGRSILALQIAETISRGVPLGGFALDSEARPVVFMDFEGNRDEFARRYSADGKQPYSFRENFHLVRFHHKFRAFTSIRKNFVMELKMAIDRHSEAVVVINNLDYLRCFMPESYILAAIKELQVRNRFSVLLISNLRGNPAHRQITPNRAGKLLTTMSDSIFAMNFSQKGQNMRYLMQLKTKGNLVYHNNHVAGFALGKEHNFTGCRFTDFGTEEEHTTAPPTDFEKKIIELSNNQPGLRMAEIADQLKTNKKRVERVLKKHDRGWDGLKEDADGKTTNDASFFSNPRLKPGDMDTANPSTDSRLCGNDGLAHTKTPPALPFDPFRGNIKPSDRPSHPGVEKISSPCLLLPADLAQGEMPNTEPETAGAPDVIMNLSNVCADNTVEALATVVTSSFDSGLNGLRDGAESRRINYPFRGDIKVSDHYSDLGVKQPQTVATVVTSSEHGLNGLCDGADGKTTTDAPLFSNPRPQPGAMDTANPSTGSRLCGNDGLAHTKTSPALPIDPFRGKVKPSDRPSHPGVNEPPEDLDESLKTLDALITSYCKDKPPSKTQDNNMTYSQQLKKRLADARRKKGNK